MKIILSLITGAAIGLVAHSATKDMSSPLLQANADELHIENVQPSNLVPHYETMNVERYTPSGFAGDYLAGLFAQNRHNWGKANDYLQKSLQFDTDNPDLLKRGLVLAIGAGDFETAKAHAQKMSTLKQEESIGQLYMAVEAVHSGDFEKASANLDKMASGGIKEFVKPLLQAWLDADEGILNTEHLRKNSVHLTHGILIAHYLGEKEQTLNLMAEALALGGLTVADLHIIADLYIDLDHPEKAQMLIEKTLEFTPDNEILKEKLAGLNTGEDVKGFERIASIQKGAARAMFDMGKLFYQENAYESAHLFAHMSLMLDDSNIEARIILADIAAQYERYKEAISYYQSIKPDSRYYIQAKREIARIMEDQGRTAEAIAALEDLAQTRGDNHALIQIGDIYRHQENFPQAIEAYNRAEKIIGAENIIPDYWHLHYMRGMAYEQNGNWELAEKDLQAALDFQPDHPYVLNYLGYSWADKGMHLEKATEMIKKAVSLRPRDGHIIDSLGWVLYKQGQYEEAVPHLEKAVELMPYDPVINDHLGDAYWKVGRIIEAKFQWERAKNHIENDDTLLATITTKLEKGLQKPSEEIMQAETDILKETQDILNP
ncbi:MAG: tetratricopeptide repeat protein [Alphaproteobacteria bacterium]